ncbi:peptidoglycan DD-metalloendopeptidase family protein [Pseudalkalibacillus decolorationis]|uniref:peptidoglycan DD-metalloendopeptidase family protein n=1 Tax=Pseudalkalibacillus decolorationis TaxID=163879 RepID=UPI0021479DB5|nr:peptidoglycan DD-metalloendopeptidase family protein [Pseudalkalibacillus decolorationis]
MGIDKHQTSQMAKVRNITLLSTLLVALSLVGFNTSAFAADDKFALIKTVYHVYVDGQELGVVHDKRVVEQMKEEIIKDAEDRFKDVQLTINEDIEYVPERIFRPEIDRGEMKKKLTSMLTIGVQAMEISVDGETLGYFKNEKEAKKVLRELKLEYVDEQTLNRLQAEEEKNEKETVPKAGVKPAIADNAQTKKVEMESDSENEKTDDSNKILNVSFSEPVKIEPAKVTPDELMSVKEAISLFNKGTLEEKKYEIKDGETKEEIAEQYDLSIDELYELNPNLKKNDYIKPGKTLNVTAYEPFAKVIVEGKVQREETIPYKTEVKEDSSMPKGETETEQDGEEGSKEVLYSVTKVNGKVTEEKKLSEEILSEPVTEITIKGTKIIPSHGTGSFHRPVAGGHISSKMGMRWGSMHKGIDFAGPSNRSILAADNGTVVSAGFNDGGYGNKIVIDHNNGFKTIYAHLASISVSAGDTVQRGQKIGVMGSTGNSTGVHLHFEVYKNGSRKDPLNYIN